MMESITVIEFKIGASLLGDKDGIELISSWVNTLSKKVIKQLRFILVSIAKQ